MHKALVKRTYTTVCFVPGTHTNCHVNCKCVEFTEKPGTDAFLRCECAILSSGTCMVCGKSLRDHYHVWGKGWRKRANKEYERLQKVVEESSPNVSVAKQRIEDYTKRVIDTRRHFYEQQTELIEKIEEFQVLIA